MHTRAILRIGAAILGGILLLAAGVIVLFQTSTGKQYAMEKLINILGEQGVTFSAGSLDWNLLQGKATLRNVTVRSKTAPDLPPILTAGEAFVDVGVYGLLGKRYRVEDAVLNNPILHLVIDEQGRDNVPRGPKKEPPDTSVTDWLIYKLRASAGAAVVEDRRQKLQVSLPAWNLAVDGDPRTNNQAIRLVIERPGEILFQQRALPIETLSADTLLVDRSKALEIKGFEIGTQDTTLNLHGTVRDLDKPVLDIKLDSNLAIEPLIKFTGVQQKASGKVGLQLSATGALSELKIGAKVNAKGLTIQRFQKVDLAADALYDIPAKRVRVSSINAGSPAGSLEGKADIALTTDVGDSTLQAKIGYLDLQQVGQTLALPVNVASKASGTIGARWPGLGFEQASGDGTVTLNATRSTAEKDLAPLSGTIHATATQQRAQVALMNLRALGTELNGAITVVQRERLGGEIRIEATNLNDTLAQVGALLAKANFPGTVVQGEASVVAKLGGSVSKPTAKAQVRAPALQVGELHDVAISIDASYDPAQVVVQDVNVRWGAQSLTAGGTVGLKTPSPTLDLSAKLQDASIADVLAGLGKAQVPATGTVSLISSVTGTIENPAGELLLTGTNLEAYSEPLGNLAGELRLENRIARVDRLRLDKQEGFLSATGTYNLESKAYTLNAEGKDLHFRQLTLPGAVPVRGDLTVTAKGDGTVDNPNLSATLTVANLQVREDALGSIDARADVAGREAKIAVKAPAYNLALDSTVGTNRPYPARFEAAARSTDLSKLPMKQPLAGNVTATVTGSGDLATPEQIQASARVSDLKVTWNDQPIQTEGPLEAQYANKMLTIQRATILAAKSRVQLEGKLPLEETAGPGAVNVSGRFDVEGLASLVPQEKPVAASGQLNIDATLRGTLKKIDPAATIALRNGSFATAGMEQPISNATLDAEVKDGTLAIHRLTADFASAKIEGKGEVPFALLPGDLPVALPRKQGPAAFTLDVKGLDVAHLPGMNEQASGTVSMHLEAQAQQPDVKSLTATLAFPQLNLSLSNYELQQQGTTTITVQNAIAQVQQFELTGPETRLVVSGTAGLQTPYPLNLKAEGNLNAAIFTFFTDRIEASGDTKLQVAASGNAQKPQLAGFVEMKGGQISSESPPIEAGDLEIRLDLSGDKVNIARLEGSLNGGTLKGGGSAGFARGELRDVDINVAAKDFYVEYPEGMHSISNANLKLTSSAGKDLLFSGDVQIVEGSYTEPVTLEGGVMRYLRSPQEVELTEERNPILERLNLNIGVKTGSPLVIQNNLAKAAINTDLRVRGTAQQTGLTGRVNVEEGGELYLQERKYLIDRGVITFTNDRRIEPSLDILARTRAANYDITLQVQGDAATKIETTLTSDPPLPEPDIISILVTGRTLEEARGREVEIAKEQVLSHLTGTVGGTLSRQLEQSTGLSQVRIEPSLIAAETQPTARLTLGQDLTRKLHLIYSMNLRDSNDQIWIGQYDITKRFSTQMVKQNDNSYRMEFRHDLHFGGSPDPNRSPQDYRTKKIVGDVNVTGNSYFTHRQILDLLKTKTGNEYDFFKVRKGLDRLQSTYAGQNLREARVRLERKEEGSTVDLNVRVNPGPKVQFIYEGWDPSRGTRKRVEEAWQEGVFDQQRTRRASQIIQEELVDTGHLRAEVQSSITKPDEHNKRVLFEVHPGTRYRNVQLIFEGARGIAPSDLKDAIKKEKLEVQVYSDPGKITDFLQRYYREQGYLDASVEKPLYELQSDRATGKTVIPIQEGFRYRVGRINFAGNSAYSAAELQQAIPLKPGQNYTPDLREQSYIAIQNLYYDKGFADVELQYQQEKNPDQGVIDLTYQIVENQQRILTGVEVAGVDHVSEKLVRSQIGIKTGEPVSSTQLSKARRNLYNTNAFSMVDIEAQPVTSSGLNLQFNQAPVQLLTKVREVRPFEIRYGGFYDTDRGPGGIVDISNRNMLGSARVIGLRTRYDSDLHEVRLYFGQPLLLRFPLKTTVSSFARRELMETFFTDRVGASIEEEYRFARHYIASFGYRLENAHTRDRVPDPLLPFDIRLRIAPLTASLTRETRDELLDATRGSFSSHAFEYAPSLLGSQIRYVRYYGQYFRYFPLSDPQRVPWANKMKTRFVYAAGVRVGLAHGLGGQELIPSERFFAGGGTTIRGFQQNRVGPLDALGDPRGGDAVFILNNEIRAPLFHIVDGVGFVDIGNVYRHLGDFNPTDIRKSAGLGIRARTPYFLLRLDYGVKLDRRTGEPFGQLFFSIGQAF